MSPLSLFLVEVGISVFASTLVAAFPVTRYLAQWFTPDPPSNRSPDHREVPWASRS